MNPFTPPTDSLYKFIAITGLISMIGGIVLLFTGSEKAYELYLKQNGQDSILFIEETMMTDELKYNIKYEKLRDSIDVYLTKLLGQEQAAKKLNDTLSKEILYNLPDSIKEKFKMIALKRQEIENNRTIVNHHISTFNSYQLWYLVLFIVGEVFAILGFILWYWKIQRHSDILERNKLLCMEIWKENCQSCYKRMFLLNERGTESDEKYSKTYCKGCYQHGKFVEPDLQFNQALERLKGEFQKRQYNRLSIYIHSINFKKCIRWKSKNVW